MTMEEDVGSKLSLATRSEVELERAKARTTLAKSTSSLGSEAHELFGKPK